MRNGFLLAIGLLSLAACSTERDKQWYKVSGNYTMADFQRDRDACTKDKLLDEDCMRGLGWASLTADEDKGPSKVEGAAYGKERDRNGPTTTTIK
ncbi:MAG TPA: hypothetical protein VEL75_12845 [Candidatus Methylomirabilis sp.]|nr:hypothetical protein [Candidatus Methylomirabilis sp.]